MALVLPDGVTRTWLGFQLRKSFTGTTIIEIDGCPDLDYLPWASGYPSSIVDQDCAVYTSAETWEDAQCSSLLPCACQITVPTRQPSMGPTPAPSTRPTVPVTETTSTATASAADAVVPHSGGVCFTFEPYLLVWHFLDECDSALS